jgi:hypothetical protein
LDAGFKNHSSIAPLLTHYLLDVVAFQDDVEALKGDVALARKEANEAKRKVDKLDGKSGPSSNNKVAKRGGAGRGNGNNTAPGNNTGSNNAEE